MIEAFWNEFLKETQRDSSTQYLEAFHFDVHKESANHLLELVLSGKKQATSSSLLAYQGEENQMPKVGDFSIVTDWDGTPRCVIETIATIILPFHEITFEICKREGEDEVLETWQTNHRNFFTADGKAQGYSFTEDMPVIFEDFKVVYSK